MIIGVDQVLLDLVVEVDGNPELFQTYKLEPNTQCLAEEHHSPLLKDLLEKAARNEVKTSPGGVIANSLRAASWWLEQKDSGNGKHQPSLNMFGKVGKDAAGRRLHKELIASGINPFLGAETNEASTGSSAEFQRSQSTGVCVCLIVNKERTMITELGISKSLHLDGKNAPEFPSWNDRVGSLEVPTDAARGKLPWVALTGGFYIQADPDGAAAMKEWCSKPQAGICPVLVMTLAANWCTHISSVQDLAREADFTFGNEGEVIELASELRKKEISDTEKKNDEVLDFDAAMVVISRWKTNGWMIGTRGSKSVGFILASSDAAKPMSVPVPPLPSEEFVDDVGAGDSFMGGFVACAWQKLAELANTGNGLVLESADEKRKREEQSLVGKLSAIDIEDAIRTGITTAAACLRCSGCQFLLV